MARVEDLLSEEDDEPEVIVEDDATEQEELDNESEASDDMSETEEAERVLELKAANLEEQVVNDPNNYDQHIQLIELIDKLSDLGRLQTAFQRLHATFPLQPEHWQLWTQTEGSMAHTQQERDAVDDLYRQATAETYSIPLYLQWVMFALSGSADEARSTFGVITRRAGYDPTASGDIWRAITEFEKLHLVQLAEDDDALPEQVVRVARCLAEQVTRPLLDTSGAVDELRQLVETHGEHLRSGYLDTILRQREQASAVREKVAEFEDRMLLAGKDEKLGIYKEYIAMLLDEHHRSGGEDTPFNYLEMCAALYDRATYNCQSVEGCETLFRGYARLAASLPFEQASRALDVCVTRRPLVAEYWVLSMQNLERHRQPFEEITRILERALSDASQRRQMERAEGEALWLGYLECVRRQNDLAVPEQRDKMRSNLAHASDALRMMYGGEADADCELALFWARLEYGPLEDPARGRQIFEDLFQNSYIKCQSRLWLLLLELEERRTPRPADKKLRDLYRRAVKFVTDYPPAVCERWRAFERERGTLDTALLCRDVCEETLETWRKKYESQRETKQNAKKGKNNKQANKRNQKQDKEQDRTPNQTGKRLKKKDDDDITPRGKKRTAEEDSRTDEVKKKKDEVKQNGLKRTHEETDIDADSKKQRTEDTAGPSNASSSSHVDVTPDKEACTLFVSNLDFKFNESALRELLGQWGTISALRFVRGVKAFGGSICYCEYTSPESVVEAVKHDRTPLEGRPVFLSHYRSSGKGKEKKFKYATTPERNKLFVKNLPFSCCTVEKLREVFAPHGQLSDVRVVTQKNGRPKGLAYIEYADEKSATSALQATDNMLLEGRHIQVALSAPPPRLVDAPSSSAPSLGQGRRDTAAHRRTQLGSLLPRALQKPTAVSTSTTSDSDRSSGSGGPGQRKPMSNSDFRSMLLNKK